MPNLMMSYTASNLPRRMLVIVNASVSHQFNNLLALGEMEPWGQRGGSMQDKIGALRL